MINALNDSRLVNKNSELINTCRHQNKLLLKSLKKVIENMKYGLQIFMFRLDYTAAVIYIFFAFRY